MTVFEKIVNLLDGKDIKYKIIKHEPVHTCEDAAKLRDTDLSEGAKALVMYGDKKPMLFVLPADTMADFKKIKSEVGIKDLRMATPKEVEELTTLKVGSIPPVGSCINLPSYFDVRFKNKEKVVFNAGSLTTSIVMSAADLIKVEKPKIIKIV